MLLYLGFNPGAYLCRGKHRPMPRLDFLRVCLDGERISERIILFGLVVENSVRLVIFQEM
jgi:hypothetical protein